MRRPLIDTFLGFFRDLASRALAAHRAMPLRTWIVLAAFVVSLGYACAYRIQPSVDARKFHEIAVNLVTKHSFCFECNVPLAEDKAIRDIGPGYQFFLAALYQLFGIRLWVVWIVQALMHALVVWWLFGLAKRLVPEAKDGFVGAVIGLYAFHPDVIQQYAMLMSESLFVFLLVAVFRLVIPLVEGSLKRQPWVVAGATGLLLGALTMTRPTGLPIFLGVLGLLAWKRRWKDLLVVFLCFLAIQAPWTVRNLRVYDKFIFNSVVGGLDFWVGLDPYGPGEFDLDKLPHITEKIKGLTPEEVEYTSLAETKNIIKTMPGFALARTVQKGFKLFALTKTSGFWFHYRTSIDQVATVFASALFNLVALGAGCAAAFEIVRTRRVRHWGIVAALAVIALMGVAPTLTVVVNRYRIPMLPFFSLIILDWLVHVRGRDRIRSLLFAGALLAATTLLDVWTSVFKIMERINQIRTRA
jgi:hypothetical protein